MIDNKIIKTEKEYEGTLARIEALMDAAPGSPQEEELELLTLLVEKYEEEHFPIHLPDPIEAILFRMEQQGLEPKDLIPYLGSQSKVSEVLNRKRPLSLSMIRNLQEGLGIPAEVLLQKPAQGVPIPALQEAGSLQQTRDDYFNCAHLVKEQQLKILGQWQAKIIEKALKQPLPPFDGERLDEELFKELARLSSYSAGPQMACELLNKKGIYLMAQKIAFETELDGACFFTPQQRPIISLTLRNDALVDFWFTLFHLLAHLYLHRNEKPRAFFESLECVFDKTAPAEERQVNDVLINELTPSNVRKTILRSYLKTVDDQSFNQAVQTLDISPIILSCLLRLKHGNAKEYGIHVNPKKVSEKLEVYG